MIPLFGRSRIMDRDETLPVLREGLTAGQQVVYVGGKPVKRQPLLFSVLACVTPLTGRQLLLVPEADRYTEQFMLYSPHQSGVPPLQTNDKILRMGVVYQVQEAKLWGDFVEARMMRVDVGPDVSGLFAPPTPVAYGDSALL